MRKPNSVIVLLYIFHIIFILRNRSEAFSHFVSEENTPRGLVTRQTLNCRYCIYHVKFTSYCELIECSRPIRFFIVSLMYNIIMRDVTHKDIKGSKVNDECTLLLHWSYCTYLHNRCIHFSLAAVKVLFQILKKTFYYYLLFNMDIKLLIYIHHMPQYMYMYIQ